MKPLLLPLFAVVIVSLGVMPQVHAQGEFTPRQFDWPQWQGPNRTAISQEKGLLQSWPEGGPKLLWKATGLGKGYSTPTVAAGRIFIMGSIDKSEYVIALREKDGKLLWKTAIGTARSSGPRCSPTVDGNRVYALGFSGDLACLDVASGDIHWQKQLRKDFEGRVGGWGYCESPLIDGDWILCTPGNKNHAMVALNKNNGEVIWSCQNPGEDRAEYSSIVKGKLAGVDQYVQFVQRGVIGVRASDGKLLWQYKSPANRTANCSTPIILRNDTVFAASAYGTGGGLAKIVKKGDKFEAEEVYFCRDIPNHHGGMVLVDGLIYGQGSGGMVCLDAESNEILWRSRQAGRGSIAYADGRLYYRSEGGEGTVFLIEPSREKFILHGQFDQPDRSRARAWAHPVIANGKLFIADQDSLFCYNVKR